MFKVTRVGRKFKISTGDGKPTTVPTAEDARLAFDHFHGLAHSRRRCPLCRVEREVKRRR